MNRSKRECFTYFLSLTWLGFGIYGIKSGVDLTQLAAYFGAFTPVVGVYIWGETKRGSNVKP